MAIVTILVKVLVYLLLTTDCVFQTCLILLQNVLFVFSTSVRIMHGYVLC